MTNPNDPCVFCQIVAREDPRTLVYVGSHAVAFETIEPVAPGHLLVVPREHVTDATVNPDVTAETMRAAAKLARFRWPCNIVTSAGADASQTIFHFHVHIVPRRRGDGLLLPWSPR